MTTIEIIIQVSTLIASVGIITGIITTNLKKWLAKEILDLKKQLKKWIIIVAKTI